LVNQIMGTLVTPAAPMTSRRRWEPMKAFAASRVSKSWRAVTSVSFSAEG
jgi:hypothetical protein